jgi:hypothetical protein
MTDNLIIPEDAPKGNVILTAEEYARLIAAYYEVAEALWATPESNHLGELFMDTDKWVESLNPGRISDEQIDALCWAAEFASVNLDACDEEEWDVSSDDIAEAAVALSTRPKKEGE